MAKYKDHSDERHADLYAFVMESTGALGQGAQYYLKLLARHADEVAVSYLEHERTWATHSFKQHCMHRLAVRFWKGAVQHRRRREARLASLAKSSSWAHTLELGEERFRTRLHRGDSAPSAGAFHYRPPPSLGAVMCTGLEESPATQLAPDNAVVSAVDDLDVSDVIPPNTAVHRAGAALAESSPVLAAGGDGNESFA